MPDRLLQLRMLEDALDYNGDPAVVVLLTGDGAGYLEGAGFHSTLERMHKRGWRIEILSWAHSCNQRMRRWRKRTVCSLRWMTFTKPSLSWNRPDQVRSLRSRVTRRSWTCRVE